MPWPALPISAPTGGGACVTREIDLLKGRRITAMFTTLIQPGMEAESSAIGVSSLTDTWLELRNVEQQWRAQPAALCDQEPGHGPLQSGAGVRAFRPWRRTAGCEIGPEGVITGSGRQIEQARRAATIASRDADIERRRRTLASRQAAVQAQILALQSEIESETADFEAELRNEQQRQSALEANNAFVVQKREDWA